MPLESAAGDLTLALEGEPEVDTAGAAVVRFPRVAEEREALGEAPSLPSILGAEKKIGKVIFGGSDDEVEQITEDEDVKQAAHRPQLKQ